MGFSDSVALQDFLRLARQSVMREAAAIKDQIAALSADSATVSTCMAAVTSATGSSGALLSSLPCSTAIPKGRKRRRQDSEAGPQQRSPADSGARVTSASAATCLPQPQPAADAATDDQDCSSRSGSPELSFVAIKSQRISEALPAVDAVYFRARTCSAAVSDLKEASAPSPLLPPSGAPANACNPRSTLQQQDLANGVNSVSKASRLPSYLQNFGQNLDAFSRFGSLRVVANLKYGDGLAAPDMICSTAFDRDDQFFATAGASRHIKVYEYANLLEDASAGGRMGGGAHYPVLDLPFRARLSCVAWNTYLKSHLLAADYDGIATLVDASTGCEVASYAEHTKRVWSVDFSTMDPQRFLSGSDDGTVRLWSLNEKSAVAAMDAKANVCSVQFSPTDPNIMAFGAANYRTYMYDLRRVQSPLAIIQGHSRAVSYVRFMGSGKRLLTASTDNALKMWDIAALVNCPAGELAVADMTFTGHTNERNFVGLSVTEDGYIATGSEDNSVVAYHASLPLPVARHSFSNSHGATPRGITFGRKVNNSDSAHFVSSVAWARHGSACVASNSQGHLRVLQLAQ